MSKIVPVNLKPIFKEAKIKQVYANGGKAYEICKKNNINIFERTACGVSYVLGYDRTYNPYYSSPQLANCFNCPMKQTCYDKQETFLPTNDDLEYIRSLAELQLMNVENLLNSFPKIGDNLDEYKRKVLQQKKERELLESN